MAFDFVKRFMGYVLLAFLLYLGILYLVQDYFIFVPDRGYKSPVIADVPLFRENPIVVKDGTRVMTWYYAGESDKPAIMYFHGNTGQMAFFAPYMKFYIQQKYPVLMVEYRGFGNTRGDMREGPTLSDAAEAFDFLKSKHPRAIIAHGYSFGCAVAIELASLRPVDGVVMEAPFLSLSAMVAEQPLPLARLVLKDGWRSDKFIKKYTGPLLILSGTEDQRIPHAQAVKLFELSKSTDKELATMTGAGHNLFSAGSAKIISDWMGKRF